MPPRTHLNLALVSCCISSLAFSQVGCSKSKSRVAQHAFEPVDACALLTNDEIKSVQRETVQSTRPSRNIGAEFTVSQCYFAVTSPVNSIVLTVTEKGPEAGGRGPKELWKETFGPDADKRHQEREKEGEREEGKETVKPEPINGVGDEAFWAATRVGGALYVLKGDRQIRISVGGAGDQKTKLEKSTALMQMVLKRL